ncbi:hypothetical protein OAP63_07470 [Vibrio sp.]|uniref:Uncharacterized protein n=1 Tax=Vibrio viridaestus TaxID=2487322 RepID=A0A3N9U9Z3_9VIBR|nr:hypothetical protein [Vibrio viridaestus]MDC0610558.1 hypothetical protein [Vibrio sp.]RQW65136.1 hypothetical protein EES38_03630 [Vibrio viridaestus]
MYLALIIAEKSVLVLGVVLTLVSVWQYGRRSHDWRGVTLMLFKRIPMTVNEYRFYRLGVALLFLAVIMRFGILTIWPTY